MNDGIVRNQDIDALKLMDYIEVYKNHGKIAFELTEQQCKDVLFVCHEFREAKTKSGFDKEQFSSENIKHLESQASFGAFTFIITQWRGDTRLSTNRCNDWVVLCITSKSREH